MAPASKHRFTVAGVEDSPVHQGYLEGEAPAGVVRGVTATSNAPRPRSARQAPAQEPASRRGTARCAGGSAETPPSPLLVR